MTQQRVYLGEHPTVFLTGGVGQVVKGQVFDVEDEDLAAFDARPDIRRVRAAKQGGKKTTSGGDEAASAAPDSGE